MGVFTLRKFIEITILPAMLDSVRRDLNGYRYCGNAPVSGTELFCNEEAYGMNNFDFTQFVTFDSFLSYRIIQDNIKKIFSKIGVSIIEYKNIENVKKDYFSSYWRKYSFELKKDDFLDGFMEWETMENVPRPVRDFGESVNEILRLNISNLAVIICSFAEKEKTCNETVHINKKDIYIELFKMSPYSFVCPNNLIVNFDK